MKTLTEHQINECNQAITITADEPNPQNGNASHHYEITVHSKDGDTVQRISFQDGPIREVGTNGITPEVLLAILIDHLRGFQSSQFSCRENAIALTKLEEATHWLHSRTRARVARGVEGTHEK